MCRMVHILPMLLLPFMAAFGNVVMTKNDKAIYDFANAKYSDSTMKMAVKTFREGSGANNTGKYNNYKYYHNRKIESMILKYMKPWKK